MVVRQAVSEPADRLFQALADPTRREIVALTLSGEHTVSSLAERFPMSFAAVQKHVAVLERAGLVVKQRQGREQRVRADPEALREAHRQLDQLEAVWRGRLDRIGGLLAEPEPEPAEPEPAQLHPADRRAADRRPPDSKEHPDDRDRRPQGP
jgi:DNA-binding transcriptional ArsR family regulator